MEYCISIDIGFKNLAILHSAVSHLEDGTVQVEALDFTILPTVDEKLTIPHIARSICRAIGEFVQDKTVDRVICEEQVNSNLWAYASMFYLNGWFSSRPNVTFETLIPRRRFNWVPKWRRAYDQDERTNKQKGHKALSVRLVRDALQTMEDRSNVHRGCWLVTNNLEIQKLFSTSANLKRASGANKLDDLADTILQQCAVSFRPTIEKEEAFLHDLSIGVRKRVRYRDSKTQQKRLRQIPVDTVSEATRNRILASLPQGIVDPILSAWESSDDWANEVRLAFGRVDGAPEESIYHLRRLAETETPLRDSFVQQAVVEIFGKLN